MGEGHGGRCYWRASHGALERRQRHLGQRRHHQVRSRDVVSQRERSRAGHREQTGGDGRRHSGVRVLEGHGSGRASAEPGAGGEERLGVRLAGPDAIDGGDGDEMGEQAELLQHALDPARVRIGRDGERYARAGSGGDQLRHARPDDERRQELVVVVQLRCERSGGVDPTTGLCRELGDPAGRPRLADDMRPPLDRVVESVVRPHPADGVVLDRLGVGDRAVEVEHERFDDGAGRAHASAATVASTRPSSECGSATAATVRPARARRRPR